MASNFIDISVFGDKALQRRLQRVATTTQRKIVRQALRASAKRIKPYVLQNIQSKLGQRTGAYYKAWKRAKIRSGATRRGMIRLGIAMPTREEFGIAPGDKYFYPAALEYGQKRGNRHVPARPHIRPAVDNNKGREFRQISRDIGRGITKAWRAGT